MHIVADDRERPSGIPDQLDRDAEVDLCVRRLAVGDYQIDESVTIERKTARDFLISLVDGRLFRQVSRLKSSADHPLVLIEGNPFHTDLSVDPAAIRGAILSVQALWYILVIHSPSIEETVKILLTIGRQQARRETFLCLRAGYRPKRFKSRQLFFLQGLPGVGKMRAKVLLERFETLSEVVNATEEALAAVDGFGPSSARKLRAFLDE